MGTLGKETRFLSLLTKDCITTNPSNKVEGYPIMLLCCLICFFSHFFGLPMSHIVVSFCFMM